MSLVKKFATVASGTLMSRALGFGREMLDHFPGAVTRVLDGSDHGITDFAQYMDEVLVFCGVPAELLAAHPFSAA